MGREPRHGDATWYDALMLASQAVRDAGPDRAAVRAWLESLGRTRPPYFGVTGPIAFTPDAARPLVMTRLRGRQSILVPAP